MENEHTSTLKEVSCKIKMSFINCGLYMQRKTSELSCFMIISLPLTGAQWSKINWALTLFYKGTLTCILCTYLFFRVESMEHQRNYEKNPSHYPYRTNPPFRISNSTYGCNHWQLDPRPFGRVWRMCKSRQTWRRLWEVTRESSWCQSEVLLVSEF